MCNANLTMFRILLITNCETLWFAIFNEKTNIWSTKKAMELNMEIVQNKRVAKRI